MELFLQICGIAILCALLGLVLKRGDSAVEILLGSACCVLLGILAVSAMEPVVDFFRSLQQLADLSSSLLAPFMKTVGIGILAQIAAAICLDAGQAAIARMVELCGSVIALYLSLPLLNAVLDLLSDLIGGS